MRQHPFLIPLLCLLFLLVPALADEPVKLIWVGDGVEGGTTGVDSSDWNDWRNWRVDGITVDLEDYDPEVGNPNEWIPTAARDVEVILDTQRVNAIAVLIPDGATGKTVYLGGQNNITGNWTAFAFSDTGTMTFERLFVEGGGSASPFNRKVATNNSTIILTGNGDVSNPLLTNTQTNTLGFGSSNTSATTNLIFTGEEIFIEYRGSARLNYRFEHPDAVITFAGVGANPPVRSIYGFELAPTADITNLATLTGIAGGWIQSVLAEGPRLTSMGGVNFVRTGNGLYDLHDVDLQSIVINHNVSNNTNSSTTQLHDLVRVMGDETNSSFTIARTGRETSGMNGRAEVLVTAGSILEVLPNGGLLPTEIGDPTLTDVEMMNPAVLRFESSTVRLNTDLVIAQQGVLIGNAGSVIEVSGNWENRSRMFEFFDLSLSTVELLGSGTSETPQTFEVHGIDVGADPDGMIDNFAIGHLVIGDAGDPTYVLLVDEFDHGPASELTASFIGSPDGITDALYLAALTVNAGSIFNIGVFAVYVDDVLLDPTSPDFDPSLYGPGLIVIPEPGTIALLLAGAALLLRMSRRPNRG